MCLERVLMCERALVCVHVCEGALAPACACMRVSVCTKTLSHLLAWGVMYFSGIGAPDLTAKVLTA